MAYAGFDSLGMDWEKAGALNNIASILGDKAEVEVDSGDMKWLLCCLIQPLQWNSG
ncbi:MAG: hypothetical protein R2769_11795 [Saprospiraceae bacterium]